MALPGGAFDQSIKGFLSTGICIRILEESVRFVTIEIHSAQLSNELLHVAAAIVRRPDRISSKHFRMPNVTLAHPVMGKDLTLLTGAYTSTLHKTRYQA